MGNRLRSRGKDFKPISDRLVVIRIKATFYNISLICGHAPTNAAENTIKEEFYDRFDGAYGACPEYDVKVDLGDQATGSWL